MILTNKYQYFIGFIRFCENKVAVAAAACMGGPPHCSHSNFIFADVDISKVLATFFVDLEARGLAKLSPALNSARTPLCKHCLGKNNIFKS